METRKISYKGLLIPLFLAFILTPYCAMADPLLQSPNDRATFDSCSLINTYQPTFSWTINQLFTSFTVLFSTSPTDFSTKGILINKANVQGSSYSWTPSIGVWKKIMAASYDNGNIRDIYWTVIGKRPDKTTVQSDVRGLSIDSPGAITVNNPSIGAKVSAATSPTFDFDTNCNIWFRLEFSPISDFSDSGKIKGFNFTTKNPVSEANAIRTLSYGQWAGVINMLGLNGYFRIKAWDALKRETVFDNGSLNIESALLGTWDITAKIKVTVSIQGHSESAVANAYDEFTFSPDETFDMIGDSGTWSQEGKNFQVFLDSQETELYMEDLFSSEGGLNVNVDLTSLSFSGTENVQGATITGKALMTMNIDIYDYNLQGTAKVTLTYNGTKQVQPTVLLLEKEPTREGNSLLETIGGNLRKLIN
jgi:hypothetical protein